MSSSPSPRLALVVLPMLLLPITLACSALGAAISSSTLLVLLQGFRLSLELVMHQAAFEGVLSLEMTFTGRNFDIVSERRQGSSAFSRYRSCGCRPIPSRWRC